MNIFLILANLFFIGSVFGWLLELVFRNIRNKGKKWINPGFCTGPYVPLYGFGLCVLFLLTNLEELHWIPNLFWNRIVLFIAMAAFMTLIEYIAGIFCLKYLKVRLWDYSNLWGNIQGIICPIFSLAWALLGIAYYYLVHPHIIGMLRWLSQNLAFSFFIGMFFGVFIIDVVHSANLAAKIKTFAQERQLVVKYEGIKDHIRNRQLEKKKNYHFFTPFRSDDSLHTHLMEMYGINNRSRRNKNHNQRKRK